MQFPKQGPEIIRQRIQFRITRNDAIRITPVFNISHQFGPHWILSNVETGLGEGVMLSFLLPQDIIMRLRLKRRRREFWFQMCPQKTHTNELIRITTKPHPD